MLADAMERTKFANESGIEPRIMIFLEQLDNCEWEVSIGAMPSTLEGALRFSMDQIRVVVPSKSGTDMEKFSP